MSSSIVSCKCNWNVLKLEVKGALTTFDNIGNGAFWTFEGGTSEKNTLYQAEMGLKITSK